MGVLLPLSIAGIRGKQGGVMVEIKGQLRTCDEGQRLYDYYCNCLDDDELCFTQEMSDAWKEWIEHKNGCDKCGYI
jgi:hypothetical protein